MQKVMVQIDWYTKTILTVITALLFGILAKPFIIPEKAVAEQEKHISAEFKLEPLLMGGPKGLRISAEMEGSAERARGDVEEMYRIIRHWDSELYDVFLEENLIETEYYQEHPAGKQYLEYLIEKARTTKQAWPWRGYASSVIQKIGDRYSIYGLK